MLFFLVNLVETAALIEMVFLGITPPAKNIFNRKQFDRRKLLLVLGGDTGQTRAQVILGDDVLGFGRIQEVQIRFGYVPAALVIDNLVDDGDGYIGLNTQGWIDHITFGFADFLANQKSFIFKDNQHVAAAASGKSGSGAAPAGIQHRHMGEQIFDEFTRLVVTAEFLFGITPSCRISIPTVAGGFRAVPFALVCLLQCRQFYMDQSKA